MPLIEETAYYSGEIFWTEQKYKLFSDICAEAMHLYDFQMGKTSTPSKAVISLPPPYSQCRKVEEDYIGVKALLDGVWIYLHPGMPSEPDTCICYKHVNIDGHKTFMARLKLEGTASAMVKFILEIRHSNSSNVVCSCSIDINAGETMNWRKRIPELEGILKAYLMYLSLLAWLPLLSRIIVVGRLYKSQDLFESFEKFRTFA